MTKQYIGIGMFFLILLLSCGERSANTSKDNIPNRHQSSSKALPTEVLSPKNNLITAQKVALGKLLFYDPILSGNKDVACATCHHTSNGFAESRDLSIGLNGKGFGSSRVFLSNNLIPIVKKNAPTILNSAFNGMDSLGHYVPDSAAMFWDLRVKSLEAQALEPIKAMEEMRGLEYSEDEILEEVVYRLLHNETYRSLFTDAFPEEQESIKTENIAKAIAAYERTILGNKSRFDAYKRGDRNALSESEKDGFTRFVEVGCPNCHNGPMFSDYKIHVLGIPDNPKLKERDFGFEDGNGFRTPTLRNLRFTFPNMHNGSLKSVKEILEFYEDISQGKSRNPNIQIKDIDPLAKSLTIRVKDFGPITNFLLSLNDESHDKSVPAFVPSGLEVGGTIGLTQL
ncbi:MAG: cytochrome c peroxidase [Saprospiraceae bacterium]|jgi:cytochrome c peroxidase